MLARRGIRAASPALDSDNAVMAAVLARRRGITPMVGRTGDRGRDGEDGKDGLSIKGDPGQKGDPGASGKSINGDPGQKGDPGFDGWSPILAVVVDGIRCVHRVVGWVGGDGERPQTGMYLGPRGFTREIHEATDIRGLPGIGGGDGAGQINTDILRQLIIQILGTPDTSILNVLIGLINQILTSPTPEVLDVLRELIRQALQSPDPFVFTDVANVQLNT